MSLKLPHVLGDHMVVQHNRPIKLWGWADASQKISIATGINQVSTIADPSGQWLAELPALPPGGPYTITIETETESLILDDVLSGEVWLCSGQSNMEAITASALNAEMEIKAADYPQIRLFNAVTKHKAAAEPQQDLEADWTICTPQTVEDFSAVGYFFGRELHTAQHIPIGLINSSWSGTSAEPWTAWSTLVGNDCYKNITEPYLKIVDGTSPEANRQRNRLAHWQKVMYWQDPGNRGYLHGWADVDFDDSDWKDFVAPGTWQSQGMKFNGAVWFRRPVFVPADWAGEELRVTLGILDDFDVTYWNGEEIGNTGQETAGWWMQPRRYPVPAHLVRPGEINLLTVRIFDWFGNGGFTGGEPMAVHNGTESIPLDGSWNCKVEYAFNPEIPREITQLLAIGGPGTEKAPSNLYNGMIAPLVNLPLRGVLWYQGESNAGRAEQYYQLFPDLIKGWRAAFKEEKLPFYFVQLANHLVPQSDPAEEGWAIIRNAQEAALALPNTAMAVAIDVGEAHDVHPRDKQSVGHRLAVIARAHIHHEKLEWSGPVFESLKVEGKTARITFSHAGGLMTRDGASPLGFVIRGESTAWFFADTKLEGESVVVWNEAVEKPAAVRYAWASNPSVNLYNAAMLPAVPFNSELKQVRRG